MRSPVPGAAAMVSSTGVVTPRPVRPPMPRLQSKGLSLRAGDQVVLALVLVAASLAVHHTAAQRVMGASLAVVLVIATASDLKSRKIPNRLTAPAALWALVLGAILHPSGLGDQAIAGLAAGGFLYIFAVIYPKGLGMGDVKLAFVIGLYLSSSAAVAMSIGLIGSALAGVVVLATRGVKEGRKVGLPLAPFLAVGGVVAIIFGPEIVHWYSQSGR
jgi:leader peptidase (prepilin peptidase)/N-methyltransferase